MGVAAIDHARLRDRRYVMAMSGFAISRVSIVGIIAQVIHQKPEQSAGLLRRWRRLRRVLRIGGINPRLGYLSELLWEL
jgi:hypothetical protein